MRHEIAWHTASPLWDRSLDDAGISPARFRAPVLLRFADDAFVEQLQDQLSANPAGLSRYVLRAETWEDETAGWVAEARATPTEAPKLYQPAHGRFYLVAASLVCRLPGLPDRSINVAALERATFVVRRLVGSAGQAPVPANPASCNEFGWLGDRQAGSWQRIADRDSAEDWEERLPLFPLSFELDGRRRRLHAGLLPVGSREIYEDGARRTVVRPETADRRVAAFQDVILAALNGLADTPDPPTGGGLTPTEIQAIEQQLAAQARQTAVIALLDLQQFLDEQLPTVADGTAASSVGAARDLYDHLQGVVLDGRAVTEMLREAGARAKDIRDGAIDDNLVGAVLGTLPNRPGVEQLASVLLSNRVLVDRVVAALGDRRKAAFRELVKAARRRADSWTADTSDADARADTLMILLDLAEYLQGELRAVWDALAANSPAGLANADAQLFGALGSSLVGALSWREALLDAEARRRDVLAGKLDARIVLLRQVPDRLQLASAISTFFAPALIAVVEAGLDAHPPSAPPENGAPIPSPSEARYVVRCVYERPACAGFHLPVVSAPSRPFRLASFFDPDAPVRPVQIRMPADTSVAGLRRFPKSVSVLMSNKLRQQMARAQQAGLQGLIDGEVGEEPAFDLGMICSFSIPIITICALILLMIIVQLLNIVFWWLPFFRICLPTRTSS